MRLTDQIRDKQFLEYMKKHEIGQFSYVPFKHFSQKECAFIAESFFSTLLLSTIASCIYSLTYFDFPDGSLTVLIYYFSIVMLACGSLIGAAFNIESAAISPDPAFSSFSSRYQSSISKLLNEGVPWWRIQQGINRAIKQKRDEYRSQTEKKQLQDSSIDQADQFLTAVLLSPNTLPVEQNPKLLNELQKAADAEVDKALTERVMREMHDDGR